ncbi:hypothetical protein FRC11_010175, partial [Ceratobasidium sp. 423]
MEYDDASLKYANFINTGLEESDAELYDPPEKWTLLPIPGPDIPESVISAAENESILALAELLPSSQRELVTGILNATNEHQAHLPASHPLGVYLGNELPPKAISPSPDSDDAPGSLWLPPDYFQNPSEAAHEGTVSHFEVWQKGRFKILLHEPSGTLYGGKNGVVRIVRPLVQLLFNFSAVRGDFTPPEDPPTDYDLTRLPINEWPRLQQWIRDWTAAIKASTAILRKTSDERRQGLATLQSLTDDDEPTFRDPTPIASTSSAPLPVCAGLSAHPGSGDSTSPDPESIATKPKPKPKKRRTPKPGTSKAKGKAPAKNNRVEDEESAAEPESEEGDSREINFEELDRTPQDEMSDEELRSNFGLEPDDLFTPDDPLGLHAKYAYNAKLPREIIQGTGSITLSSYAEYSPTNHVFGEFPNLCKPVPTRVTTPESAAKLLLAFEIEAQRWLFSIRAIWMRAQAMAPLALSQSTTIAYVLHEGLQLQTIVERIIETGNFPDPLVSPQYLNGLILESRVLTVELQWMLSCLMEWNSLSSHHYNKMKGSFLRDKPPSTLTETATLCQATLKFRDEGIALEESLLQELRKLWRTQLKTHPVPQDTIPGFFYVFGVPQAPDQESSQLRGNLVKLQEALVSSTLQDGVEELPAPPTIPTSTPSKNPPLTTPAAMMTTPPPQSFDAPSALAIAQLSVATEPTGPTIETAAPGTEPAPPTTEPLTRPTVETASPANPPATGSCPRPKMRPPPNSNTPPTTNEASTAIDGDRTEAQEPRGTPAPAETPAVEPPAIEPPAIRLGSKRKRDPNSPKGPRRASVRIYDQGKA